MVLTAFLTSVAFGGDGKKEEMTDLKAIQGKWESHIGQGFAGGRTERGHQGVQGQRLDLRCRRSSPSRRARPETHSPSGSIRKRNPSKLTFGKDLAGQDENRPYEGIYTLSGDKLTICYTVFNVRPTDFSMGRGIAATKCLVVLERVKK